MFPPVDTKSASAVAAYVEATFTRTYPAAAPVLIRAVFRDIERLFAGQHPDYGPIDLRYHDLEHTLQATLCITQLLEGRHHAAAEPRLTSRQFELAIAAALLHDSGYLKHRSDTAGTGAKYTYCHVLRSCAFAASYLPTLGVNDLEVECVLSAINCTGPARQVSRLHFREPVDRVIGCALVTGDYLGQMAAPDYPAELEILFNEFRESDTFAHVPPSRRTYETAAALVADTPRFWREFVMPKLEDEFSAVYRYLAQPFPHGPNPYIEAVEKNIARIERHSLLHDAVLIQ